MSYVTHHDDELGFPGNREVLESELRKATTQLLYLSADPDAGHRSLLERGAEAVHAMEIMPVAERFWSAEPAPHIVAYAARDGIPADIAEAYVRAKSEVKAILAEANESEPV